MSLENSCKRFNQKDVMIEIFGLGYVGFPLLVKLASGGYRVRGIDVDKDRINRLNSKKLLESENNLKIEFFQVLEKELVEFNAVSKYTEKPKMGIICVPTPIPNDKIKSSIYVESAVQSFLSTAKKGDGILIESSVEVGTTEYVRKIIEKSGFLVGKDFGLGFCPERIDPQNKKWNLENIPRIIYCSDEFMFRISQSIYKYVNHANLIRVKSPKIAEVVKSYENAFRLVNISMVNELALLCNNLKIDVNDVIKAASTKPFGFMPFYPSAGVGGHCIPKDPIFLRNSARQFSMDFQTIDTAISINQNIPKTIVNNIQKILVQLSIEKSVIILGLAYKSDIEDMRDSPGFKLAQEFKNNGFKVSAYDPFFKSELLKKYLIENNLNQLEFEIIDNIDDDKYLEKFSCLCVVQHHTKTRFRISDIYKKSLIKVIYDCQNKLNKDKDSKTILNSL